MSNTFLAPEEMEELSGICTGRNGKAREQLQVEWLRKSGIRFWVNARGRPIVARAEIEGRASAGAVSAENDAGWVPRVLAKAG